MISRFLQNKNHQRFDVSVCRYNENPEKSAGVAGEIRKLCFVSACIFSNGHSNETVKK
jgi:hypothetical protein